MDPYEEWREQMEQEGKWIPIKLSELISDKWKRPEKNTDNPEEIA